MAISSNSPVMTGHGYTKEDGLKNLFTEANEPGLLKEKNPDILKETTPQVQITYYR